MSCVWRLRRRVRLNGATRTVLLVGPFAIKGPKMRYGWRLFLQGLLANMQEVDFSRTGWPELCPVLWFIPGGWLVVMRRAREMTVEEFERFDAATWRERGEYMVPAELKHDSYGWLGDRVVAIDYGNAP